MGGMGGGYGIRVADFLGPRMGPRIGTGGAASIYAAYALAERFTVPEYWVSGTKYTPVSTLPGYSSTRSGIQGAVDASGAVQFFAANVPAINSAGYAAYGANTNLNLQSQAFDDAAWTKAACTVTANNVVAPDGITTADTLTATATTGVIAYQLLNVTNATTYSTSVFIPAGGTSTFAYIQVNLNVGIVYVAINRSTGAVGAKFGPGSAGAITGYSQASGGGWRFTVVWVADTTSIYTAVGLSDNATTTNVTNGVTLPVWQYQTIAGNFPDGGPLIATAGATASIADSLMSVSDAPIDQDMVFIAVANFAGTNASGTFNYIASWQNAGSIATFVVLRRDTSNNIAVVTSSAGGTGTTSAPTVVSGRAGIVLRYRANKWSYFVRNASVTTSPTVEGTASTMPAIVRVVSGNYGDGAQETNSPVEFVGRNVGTFSDAQCQALLLGLVP